MGTIKIKRTMITALAGAVVAGAAGAPAAWGMPADPLGAPASTGDPAPPPSSIAASAADDYSTGSSGGFDASSAAIGAAGTGLIVVLAAGGLAWRRPATRTHRTANV